MHNERFGRAVDTVVVSDCCALKKLTNSFSWLGKMVDFRRQTMTMCALSQLTLSVWAMHPSNPS